MLRPRGAGPRFLTVGAGLMAPAGTDAVVMAVGHDVVDLPPVEMVHAALDRNFSYTAEELCVPVLSTSCTRQ